MRSFCNAGVDCAVATLAHNEIPSARTPLSATRNALQFTTSTFDFGDMWLSPDILSEALSDALQEDGIQEI